MEVEQQPTVAVRAKLQDQAVVDKLRLEAARLPPNQILFLIK